MKEDNNNNAVGAEHDEGDEEEPPAANEASTSVENEIVTRPHTDTELRSSTRLIGRLNPYLPRPSWLSSPSQKPSAEIKPVSSTKGDGFLLRRLQNSAEEKVVGLKNFGLDQAKMSKRRQPLSINGSASKSGYVPRNPDEEPTIEEMEEEARRMAIRNPFKVIFLGNLAAFRVMLYYLITFETVATSLLTVGLTYYWYKEYKDDPTWSGASLNFILLTFVVVTPVSAAIGMAFTRREGALVRIASFRSYSYQIYLCHCLWDWNEKGGRAAVTDVNWLEHCDAVLAQLVGIGDELSRFLSLPNSSRSRHRMTSAGRREAARTIQVAYNLLESMATQRITRLVFYSERLKKIGLPAGESSRLRQDERFLSESIEQLRMVKMYRTPQALRSLARIFTVFLPPFYSPAFAQVAISTHSLGIGIVNGVIVALALTGLFLSLEVLEDPFTAFLALDGIDVREEFEVLHYAQLIHTRDLVFPNAPPFPLGRRAALRLHRKKLQEMESAEKRASALTRRDGYKVGGIFSSVGQPPIQEHHCEFHHHFGSDASSRLDDHTAMDWDDEEMDHVHHADYQYANHELGAPMDDDDDDCIRQTAFQPNAPGPDPGTAGLSNSVRSRARSVSGSTATGTRWARNASSRGIPAGTD